MEEVRRAGATNYNSRRLLEMYSNKSVLTVANLSPSSLNNKSLVDFPRELQPLRGKFDK